MADKKPKKKEDDRDVDKELLKALGVEESDEELEAAEEAQAEAAGIEEAEAERAAAESVDQPEATEPRPIGQGKAGQPTPDPRAASMLRPSDTSAIKEVRLPPGRIGTVEREDWQDEVERAARSGTTGVPGRLGLTEKESKDFIKAVERQRRARRRTELDEAKRLQEQAREIVKRQKEEAKYQEGLRRHEEWVQRMAEDLGFDPDRPITPVPDVPEDHEEVEFITIRKGRAYIRVLYDNRANTHVYHIIEPVLNTTETEIREFLRDTLVRTLDGRHSSQEDWDQVLDRAVRQAILDHSILVDEVSTERILYHLSRDFLGYGPIDVLMRDPMLEDISCDGPGVPIYIFHRQYESIKTNIVFQTDEELDSYVIRLAQRSGKHISVAEPLLDATTPDGSRLQATLSKEVTTRGSSFTIRKFRADPFTPPDLVQYGTMDSRMAAFFWLVVEQGASMILAGGTASGKTTTLNAVCQFIPPSKKVVSIEDTREINLRHENWIAGVTRAGFGTGTSEGGSGAVNMYRLLEAALRQRPEYLLVGEVRGKEALTLFQAMATGHIVYSTMHADSVPSAVYRLENPPIGVPRLMLQTLDLVVIQGQIRDKDRMVRRVLEVTEITGFDSVTGELLTNTVFQWDPDAGSYIYTGKSFILDQIMHKRALKESQVEREWENRIRVLEWLIDHGMRNFEDVAATLTEYYQHPAKVMDRLTEGQPPLGKARDLPEEPPDWATDDTWQEVDEGDLPEGVDDAEPDPSEGEAVALAKED